MASNAGNPDIDSVVESIRQSKKYRDVEICEDTIRDLLARELERPQKRGDAIKAAKKRLHHVMAPYLGNPDYDRCSREVETAFQARDPDALKKRCARIMAAHASTRERLPILDRFHAAIFAETGAPRSLLDLACGLHPLSFPWMGLPSSTRYFAYDIHRQRVDFLNRYFSRQGLTPGAAMQDIVVHPPQQEADLALLFKEVHRLESRRRGCTAPLLDALRVRHLAISLPTRNLTGRRSLLDKYRRLFYDIIAGRSWPVAEIVFENEIVFCVEKDA